METPCFTRQDGTSAEMKATQGPMRETSCLTAQKGSSADVKTSQAPSAGVAAPSVLTRPDGDYMFHEADWQFSKGEGFTESDAEDIMGHQAKGQISGVGGFTRPYAEVVPLSFATPCDGDSMLHVTEMQISKSAGFSESCAEDCMGHHAKGQISEVGGFTGPYAEVAPLLVATPYDGDSMLHKAEGQSSGDEGFTESDAEDEFSDSESETETELNPAAEELYKLGDGLWINEGCLACFEKPKDFDIILYQNGVPGDKDHQWMAIAPEWTTALGFGSTKEEACEDLQIKLMETKEWFIEDKLAYNIKKVPVMPCKENAEKVRYSEREASYYEKLEKDSTHWEWSTIRA